MSWIAVVSTAYCLTGTMADGSFTREASVAHNGYRLGTTIEVSASPFPRRLFVVRDRIGWGTDLDFWTPSCLEALRWGRRVVRIKVVEPGVKARVQGLIHHERAAALAQRYHRQLSAEPDRLHQRGG